MIDNTEYPEALNDPDWSSPAPIPRDNSKDVFLTLDTYISYTSNNKYYFWTFIFTIVLVSLAVLLMISFLAYFRMTCKYNQYAKERKDLKRELMKIRDTEYANFLEEEKLNISKM